MQGSNFGGMSGAGSQATAKHGVVPTSSSSSACLVGAVGNSGVHPLQRTVAVGGVNSSRSVGGRASEVGSAADGRASVAVGSVDGWPQRDEKETTALLRRLACCLGSSADGS